MASLVHALQTPTRDAISLALLGGKANMSNLLSEAKQETLLEESLSAK